ncbi:hypothetical protein AAMO2058_001173500 [Amorphochlora amoebiformis]
MEPHVPAETFQAGSTTQSRMGEGKSDGEGSRMAQKSTETKVVGSEMPTAIALWTYKRRAPQELSFSKGDKISVYGQYDKIWWKGRIDDQIGYFPAQYVSGLEEISVEESDDDEDAMQDEEYFDEYSTLKLHLEMLSDRPRTLAYKNAVEFLRPHIEGKIVLDIGCGSGILSMFCAKNGAKHVYGIDASDILHKATSKVIEQNKLADRITLLHGKIEDIKLPVAQVDVIISEWMGTFLVAEGMLDSVLRARKLYLRPNGLLLPSQARVRLAPVSDPKFWKDHIGFWGDLKDIYGVSMSCLTKQAKKEFFGRPRIKRCIPHQYLIADPKTVWTMDLTKFTSAQLKSHSSTFSYTILRNSTLHAFVGWFDVGFGVKGDHAWDDGSIGEDMDSKTQKGRVELITLSTAPSSPDTHWKQALFFLEEPQEVKRGDKIEGDLMITRNKTFPRHFKIKIRLRIPQTKNETEQEFYMWR